MKANYYINVLLVCCFIISFNGYTQKSNYLDDKIVQISLLKKDSKSIYKFNGIKEYNEFAMPQRIERFKTMINNDIDVNYKKHTIVLTMPTDGIKESDLTKIISTISKVHGFQSYSVTEIEGEK